MSFFGCIYDDPGGSTPPPPPPPADLWGSFYDDDVGFVLAVNGGGVGLWVAEDGVEQRIQTNNSLEPILSTGLLPGRGAIMVSADRSMSETVTLPIAAAVVVVAGLTGSRVALTIDSSGGSLLDADDEVILDADGQTIVDAITTKPAVALVLEEY